MLETKRLTTAEAAPTTPGLTSPDMPKQHGALRHHVHGVPTPLPRILNRRVTFPGTGHDGSVAGGGPMIVTRPQPHQDPSPPTRMKYTAFAAAVKVAYDC